MGRDTLALVILYGNLSTKRIVLPIEWKDWVEEYVENLTDDILDWYVEEDQK